MEKLGDDELSSILSRISDSRDRKSCSEVCRAWARAEGLSRVFLRVLDPWSLPHLLPRFPNLASFEATRSISDSHLETLARACPALETLNLSLRRSRFTIPEEELDQGDDDDDDDDDFGDHGLRAVAIGCPRLRKVYLRRRRGINDVGVAVVVRYATNLSVLDLSRCSRIADEAIEAIASMSSLMALILHGCSLVTDLGLSHLANGAASQTLRRLDLSECDQISDNGVCLLPKMENLQELDLAECGPKVTDFGGFAIASIYNLKWLNLSWLINLSNATIISLALNCVNLAEIDLTGCELITGTGVQAFAGHGSMEVLVLASCLNVSADDIAHVVFRCPALRYLGLDKSLRGWMSSSAREQFAKFAKFAKLCMIDWL